MKIAIIDGQGGGLGKRIIEVLRTKLNDEYEIIALGTNSTATSNMIKAGAKTGATGENAIKVTSQKVDFIVGPLAIILANSMMGEITASMAEAIASSPAKRILLPLNRCNTQIVGTSNVKLNDLINKIIDEF